jgi:drug/metabolite transporter (DMT)-like permease
MNDSIPGVQWRVIFAFAAIYVIWGSTYLGILFAIESMPPFLMSSFRFLAAGLILYAWTSLKGEKHTDLISLSKNAICGILMLVGGTVSVTWAEQYLSSGMAAIIVTAVPFWFILLDKRQWSFYFSNKIVILGLLIGFVGVLMLIAFSKQQHADAQASGKQWLGAIAIGIGSIAWTTGSLVSKYNPAKTSMLMNASIQLLAAGFFCLVVSIFTGEAKNFSFVNVSTSSWLGFLYLAIMGSIVAYVSYLWLLKIKPPAVVSTYVYVNPIVALLLGALIAKEKITALNVSALAVIMIGLVLVNMAKTSARSKKLALVN